MTKIKPAHQEWKTSSYATYHSEKESEYLDVMQHTENYGKRERERDQISAITNAHVISY